MGDKLFKENGTFKSIWMITTFRTKMSKDLPSGTKKGLNDTE